MQYLRNISAGLLLATISSITLAGQYDGIYQVAGQTDYTVVYQTGNMLIMVDLSPTTTDGTDINGTWAHTRVGTFNGNVATVNTSDHVHVQTTVFTFNPDGTITATTPSCRPATGYSGADACDMLGRVITVRKIY